MSLFDMIKEKAAELLGGASEKVAEVTEAGQGVVDAASAQGTEVLGADTVGDVIDPGARS